MSKELRMAKSIDFKKYRAPELAEKVTGIIDVRGKFLSGAKVILLGFCLFLFAAVVLFWRHEKFAIFELAIGYSLVAGVIFSMVMAVASVVKSSLAEMQQLMALLFATTKQVSRDVTAVGQGDAELPSARKLVEGVYADVMLPTVEQVVTQSLGWCGKPLLLTYRMTLGRVVRAAIKLVPDSGFAQNEEALKAKADSVVGELTSIKQDESSIVSALTWAEEGLDGLGGKAAFFVLLPCYAIATLIVIVLLIPLSVLYFWGVNAALCMVR